MKLVNGMAQRTDRPDGRRIRAGIISRTELSNIDQVAAFPDKVQPVQVEDDGTTI